jgi:hypothetical protein
MLFNFIAGYHHCNFVAVFHNRSQLGMGKANSSVSAP